MSDSKQPVPSDAPPSYEESSQPANDTKPPPSSTTTAKPPLRPFALDLPILRSLRSRRVVLASASPRRRALLAQLGLPNVEVVPSTFAEDLPKNMAAFTYVLETARAKCMAVYRATIDSAEKGEPALVLAADTIIVSGTAGTILEKPRSEAQHRAMLRTLRGDGLPPGGNSHLVVTAVVAMAPLKSARDPGYVQDSHTEETTVTFAPDSSDELLDAYVRTREGADKAGGYGIQGIGAVLVEKIEGNFENVVGLPLRGTLQLIKRTVEKAEDEETLEGELIGDEEEQE